MKTSISLSAVFLCLFTLSSINAQKIHVKLDTLTTLDISDIHTEWIKSKPNVKLKLPNIDTVKAGFSSVFYTGEDHQIDIMVVPKEKYEELYIDINNDEDLTNDDSPFVFPYDENRFEFDIISNSDKNQKTRLVLLRKPIVPESQLGTFVDKDGNLSEYWTQLARVMEGDFDYSGKKGIFYFDERVTLSRGFLNINGEKISIGLFDFTNNGLFNNEEDVLLIDTNKDGKLTYNDESEIFFLNDVFPINNNNYKIQQIDKYGKWIDIVKTDEQATFYFLKKSQIEKANNALQSGTYGELDQSFWNLNLITLKNKKLKLNNFKGKFLILNFWGEWCKPCVAEIPYLIEITNEFSKDKLEIISFLKTNRLEKAKRMIKEKMINWPQILLLENIETQFKINGYPTNIMIFPDGKQYMKTTQINKIFVANFIK